MQECRCNLLNSLLQTSNKAEGEKEQSSEDSRAFDSLLWDADGENTANRVADLASVGSGSHRNGI